MSARNPFGWDLPPGCSQRDIDKAMGEDDETFICCKQCDGTGQVFDDRVPNAFLIICPHCKGEGEREMTSEEIAEAKQDAADYAADCARDKQIDKEMGL